MFAKDLADKTAEINSVELHGDRDYAWVWDYAQFRFKQSLSDLHRAEDKATALIKYAISGFGLFWALFVYFAKNYPLAAGDMFNFRIVLGLIALSLSVAFGGYCLLPVRTILPYGEEVAIRFINEDAMKSARPQCRFGLGLKLCSDFREEAATRKFWCVLVGFIALVFALILIFAGFYSWMTLSLSCGLSP